MSFKDLTARAAAAMEPKPAEPAKTPAKELKPKTAGEEPQDKSKKP